MARCTLRLMVILCLASCSLACTRSAPAPSTAATHPPATPIARQLLVDFEKCDIGKTPPDFTPALTGGGGAISWIVQNDAGKKVLSQTSADGTDYRFPVCVYNGISSRDVDVTVRFKAVSGQTDQAAGLVVRFKDQDNYYVVRANALEDNVRLYKVQAGSRKQFAGTSAKVASGSWHALGLAVIGAHFQVTYDGALLFEADDETFADPGKIGLWTKADSVTSFADLDIKVRDAR